MAEYIQVMHMAYGNGLKYDKLHLLHLLAARRFNANLPDDLRKCLPGQKMTDQRQASCKAHVTGFKCTKSRRLVTQ